MMADLGLERGSPQIDLSETADFDLGGLRVRPAHREVEMSGERRELEPRVAQVLVALALARPGVVSRDRLIDQCWDGRIVGDDAINRCIVALRHLAKEFSPQPFAIETVPRVGYCVVEAPAAARPRGWLKDKRIAAVALLVLVLAVAALTVGLRWSGGAAAEPASIAVLPFRNLSSGDPYFAEGVGEEILGQLAREPQFRVAGRASSSAFGKDSDFREVARKLDVDYVLEGSVRTQGNRVRVNADLMRASDGVQLWSDSYDGRLDDIFAIQQRIGGAIAGALRRKLVGTPVHSGPLVTKGDVYNLYLTARGLIRTRNRRVGGTAADLLRDAIKIDPGYAPAWASLATAVQMDAALKDYETFVAANRQARAYARHSVRLAPTLGEAHRALGMALGYGDPAGQAHLQRAAELEPNSAETWVALGASHSADAQFGRELAAYRRAAELDPLWFRTVGATAIALSEMGDRKEAEAVARRGFLNNAIQQNLVLGRIAWTFGDFSEAARRWSMVVRSGSPRWAGTAHRNVKEAKFSAGLAAGPLVAVPPPPHERLVWRIWMDAPPSPDVWQARNRDPVAAAIYRGHNHVGAKLLLNSGRARELAAGYEGVVGLLGHRPRQPPRADQLGETPVVALALRAAGRNAEANRLLLQADAAIRMIYRRGGEPFWLDADAAAIFAARGRNDEALSMLERAMARGWSHSGSTDLKNIAEEPAFRALHGQPRFERIRARLAAHYAREGAEIVRLRL